MVELVLALRERGHEVDLALPTAPKEGLACVYDHATRAGAAPALVLERGKGASLWRDRLDARRLRNLVVERDIEIVHTWHTRDHVLALRASAGRRRAGATRVVRSYKIATPIPPLPWNRWLFGPGSDGLICVSPRSAQANERLRGGRPSLGAFGAIDTKRFRPAPPDEALRRSLGIEPEHRVVGIVARAQRHRRFDLLLEAAARLFAGNASARLLVIGRGTNIEETAQRPAERLGIADRVIFAGYRTDDYIDVLRCASVFTFLVPGSDGGCRALLEAAACGLPAVTSTRGALPEIVVDGETGLLVEEDPVALASAWEALLGDETRRAGMGAAARRRAETHFDRSHFAEQVEAFYASLA
jgi:glycosyltransferase involved in cell wall biosynthesis